MSLFSGPTPRGQFYPPAAPQQDLSSTLEKFSKICLPLTLDFSCSLLVLFCARRLFYANRHAQGAPEVEQPPAAIFSRLIRLTRDGLGVPRGGAWGAPLAHLAAPPISSKPGRTTPRSGALSDSDRVLAKPCRLACPYLSFIRILFMCLCERPQRRTGFEVTLPRLSNIGGCLSKQAFLWLVFASAPVAPPQKPALLGRPAFRQLARAP